MIKLKNLGIVAALGFMTMAVGAGLAFAGNAVHDNSYSEVKAANEKVAEWNMPNDPANGSLGTITIDSNVTFTAKKADGSTDFRYYSKTIRTYAGNTGTFTFKQGITVSKIQLVPNMNAVSGCDNGTKTNDGITNIDSSKPVILTFAKAKNAFTGIKVFYSSEGGGTPDPEPSTPTIQTVAILDPVTSVNNGETIDLAAEVTGLNLQAADKVVTWSVNPAESAEITKTGDLTATLTAKVPGKITVTATSASQTLENKSSTPVEIEIIDNTPEVGVVEKIDFCFANSAGSENIYTDLTVTTNKFSVAVTNANKGPADKNWDHIRVGKKNSTVTPTITTASPIEKPIEKIKLTLNSGSEALSKVTKIDILVSSDSTFTDNEIVNTYNSIDFNNEFVIPNPVKNAYYQIAITIDNPSSNGIIRLDTLKFFEEEVKTLNEITATVKPEVQLHEDETPNIADFIVTAKYLPHGEKVVENATITSPTKYVLGNNAVTISYTEDGITKTATVNVNALQKRVANDLAITVNWANSKIFVPSQWDVSGIKVELLFNDNSREDITSLLDVDYTIGFYKVGTQEVVAQPTVGMTEIDVYVAYMSGNTILEKTQTVAFTTEQIEMSLSWTKRNTTFNVGDLFSLKDGVLVAKFNNGMEEAVDFVADSDRIDVLIDGVSFDYKNTPLTLKDNGKKVTIYYMSKDGNYDATTTAATLTVLNQKEIIFKFPETSTALGYPQSTNNNNMNYYNHIKLDADENVFLDCGPGDIDNGAIASGGEYRLYEKQNNGKFTISCKPGLLISSITLTYTVSGGGNLGTTIKSGTPINDINSTSKEFNISSTGGSGQIRITEINVIYIELTAEEKVQYWIDTYMHMNDNSFKTETDTGACKGPNGTYLSAKEALLALGDETITLLQSDERFAAAEARYDAWARANQDYENRYTAGLSSNMINVINDSSAIIVVIAVAVLSLSAIAFFVVIQKRKQISK